MLEETGPSERHEMDNPAEGRIYHELAEMVRMREGGDNYRSKVVEGLTDVKGGRFKLDDRFRFLVTASVQAAPGSLGEWLDGNGNGFTATDRPVNASLIDNEHNWTFAGENGFIISPPVRGEDIVAARPHDIGSNDMERQPIDMNAEQLLAETDLKGYNHINLASGKLAGVYIRQDEFGNDLGNPEINKGLRAFAEERGIPLVEIPVRPQEIVDQTPQITELQAKSGNRLWKIRIPSEGEMYEIDVIKLQPGEIPRGMQLSENGFDLRIQKIDRYGKSEFIVDDHNVLQGLRAHLEAMEGSLAEEEQEPVRFALSRFDEITKGK